MNERLQRSPRCLSWRATRLASIPVFLLLLSIAGCGPKDASACDHSDHEDGALCGRLTITGSSTCAPLVAELARHFEGLHPDLRIDVQSGGSSRGVADALSGVAAIGMASRELKPDEIEKGLLTHPIAADGVGVIVHASRPLVEITRDELTAVYTGRSGHWSDMGGGDGEIVVTNKAAGRATLEVFLQYLDLEEGAVVADIIVGENQQAIKTVAGNPDAIGYVSIGEAAREIELGAPIRLIAADGVDATRENVANGSYPISRRLNLVTAGEPSDLARAFLDFAQSADAHRFVEAAQFVPAQTQPAR